MSEIAKESIASALDGLGRIFKPEVNLYIVAHHPGNPDACILMCTLECSSTSLREALDDIDLLDEEIY